VPLSYGELKSPAEAGRDWLWQGHLLPGAVTLLTSLWKSGKTTLLSVLLSRLKTGGELAGLPVRAGRAVVVSGESPELWWERGRTLALDGHVQWLCRPYQGRLRAYSRYAATPPSWVIEWSADGTDYRGLGPSAEPDFEHGWPVLLALLGEAEGPMFRRDIFRASPAAPARLTLWKWLSRAVRQGQVLQHGGGTRREPYRYSLPGMAEKWQAQFLADFNRRLERAAKFSEPPS
jgi:hypothetical protein